MKPFAENIVAAPYCSTNIDEGCYCREASTKLPQRKLGKKVEMGGRVNDCKLNDGLIGLVASDFTTSLPCRVL